MAFRVVRNTRQNALVLFTSTDTLTIAGNNSVSEIGLSSVTDNITGCSIKQAWASSDSGAGASGWTIARGANTVLQMESTAWWDLAGNGCAIDLDSTATLVATRTGTFGTLLVELQKEYANTGAEVGTSNY